MNRSAIHLNRTHPAHCLVSRGPSTAGVRRRARAAASLRRVTLTTSLALLAALAACGGGTPDASGATSPGPTSAPVPPVTPTPEPTPAPVSEVGKVILYLATSQSGSTYDPYSGLTIETSGLSVLRVVPELRRVAVVAHDSSASYANNTLAPYTVDDRLFYRSGSPAPEIPGIQRWSEADPMSTRDGFPNGQLLQDGAIRRGCSAVVGDRYYFEGNATTDVFRRTYYGDFRVATLGNAQAATTQLLPRGDRDACRGNLHAAGGRLYDAEFDGSTGLLQLHRRSLDTGRIVDTVSIALTDSALWGPCGSSLHCNYKFAFDDGVAYFARLRTADQRLQVWRYRFGGPAAVERVHDTTLPGFTLSYMDSDDGQVLLADGAGMQALVVDASSGSASLYTTAFRFFDPQILVVRP